MLVDRVIGTALPCLAPSVRKELSLNPALTVVSASEPYKMAGGYCTKGAKNRNIWVVVGMALLPSHLHQVKAFYPLPKNWRGARTQLRMVFTPFLHVVGIRGLGG